MAIAIDPSEYTAPPPSRAFPRSQDAKGAMVLRSSQGHAQCAPELAISSPCTP